MLTGVESIRFLIVEDHPFQSQMIARILRSLGAVDIRISENGAEAMRISRESPVPPGMLISDVMMPDVDGLELIPMLGGLDPKPALVLASSTEWMLDVARTIAEGHGIPVLGTVVKPVTAEKLRTLIQRYLDGRAAAGAGVAAPD